MGRPLRVSEAFVMDDSVAVPEMSRRRSARWAGVLVAVVIGAWSAGVWSWLRPAEIASDWNSWRQTDTQTIAINLTKPGTSILRPQINWGGDGPGYVETELQLYTKIVSLILPMSGPKEWPGQLISLLAIVCTGGVVFVHLSRQYAPFAAAFGVMAFLAARTSPHLATVVMPDALALLAYVVAWSFFWQFAREGRTRHLVFYGVAGTLAMLTKPTTAHLGISSFVFLAFAHRQHLRNARVWVTWIAMVSALVLYLWHAHRLYLDYGNTFGLLSGEDSKVPRLQHLLMPEVWSGAFRNGVGWGIGYAGGLALLVQTLRRRLTAEQVALATGNVAVVLLALRYMSQDAGNYYFAPGSLLAALAVGGLANWALGAAAIWRYGVVAGMMLLTVVQGYRNAKLRYFYGHYHDPDVSSVVRTGKALSRWTAPGDLVCVRSVAFAYDSFWQVQRNYHEPRIFYLTGTRGWTLGREETNAGAIADAARHGAQYFVDSVPEGDRPFDRWLQDSAELVWSEPGAGRIWRLRGRPVSGP